MTIDRDTPDPMASAGLSMAARAQAVTDANEVARVLSLLPVKYPEYGALPKAEQIRVFRLTPKVISILDYSKGFGHADLVTL